MIATGFGGAIRVRIEEFPTSCCSVGKAVVSEINLFVHDRWQIRYLARIKSKTYSFSIVSV